MPRWSLFFLLILLSLQFFPEAAAARKDVPLKTAMTVNRARQLLDEGKIAEAMDMLSAVVTEKTAKGKSPHYLISFMLGNCHLQQGDPAQAITYYRTVVAARPDFIAAWLNLGKALYDQGQVREAGAAFLSAYETSDGKDARTLYYSSVCFSAAEDHQYALDLFQRLSAAHPEAVQLTWKQIPARAYLMLDQPRQGLPYIEELAAGLTGDRRKLWQEVLVYQYIQLDMLRAAEDYVSQLTRDDPLDPKWWKIHAYLLLQDNRYREALPSLTIYAYLTPPSGSDASLLGDIHLMVDIPIKAVRLYKQQLALNQETGVGDPMLFKKIAQGYFRLYDSGQALQWIDEGLRKHSADVDLLKLKGYLLYESGQYKVAAEVFDKLSEILPEAGEIWMMAGYTAWQRDHVSVAARAFNRARSCDGHDQQANAALKQLKKFQAQRQQ